MPDSAYSAMRVRAPSGVPSTQRSRRSSSQAVASSLAPPKMATWASVRRAMSASSRPTSVPAIAERASVAGSRPMASQAASRRAMISRTWAGLEELMLYSSA